LNLRPLDPSTPALLIKKTFAQFEGGASSASLSEHCLVLLAEQRESWRELKDAYDALKTVRTRSLSLNGFSVLLYYNPGRLTSATAAVGKKDIKERPCFLCLDSLPSEQKGIFYRNDYLILCNPRPVLPSHFTIAHVDHRPQAILESFNVFLNLTADLGHGWITLYNGPRCGASAPDHLHFQALPTGHMPLEREIHGGTSFLLATQVEGVSIYAANGLGREILMLEGDNRESMTQVFSKVLAALKNAMHADDEPMVNVAGFYDKSWLVALFPRQKHRPDVFYREGDERIVVSPGVVEMAGVLVTPMEKDFELLDAATVEAIYREVSMNGVIFAKVIQEMRQVP
jgi:hypothetical protein